MHGHSLQLLQALTKIFPSGEGDLKVTQLFSGLACTAYPTRDTLYKQLGNLCILHRESVLCAAGKANEPILDVLRRPPVLSSSTEEQYSAATVAEVASLEQFLTQQNTASALRTLASQRGGMKGWQQPSKPASGSTRGGPCGVAPEVVSPTPGRLSPRRLLPKTPRVFVHEEGR